MSEQAVLKKGFDINKHNHHLFAIDCLKDIVNNKYSYTMSNLSILLDLKESYIQRNLMDKLNTLYITPSNKANIRKYDKLYKYEKATREDIIDFENEGYTDTDYLETYEKTMNLMEEFYKIHTIDVLKKRILITEQSVDDMIRDTFKRDNNGFLEKLTDKDIKLIKKYKLKSTTKLKEIYGCDYDIQLYRILRTKDYVKYVIDNDSNKNNLARYLIFEY